MRQFERRSVVGIPLAHEPEVPTALFAKSGELMLAQDVSGEAVGICSGLPLSVGQEVDLAMSLLKRLTDTMVFEPTAPVKDGFHAGCDGMRR